MLNRLILAYQTVYCFYFIKRFCEEMDCILCLITNRSLRVTCRIQLSSLEISLTGLAPNVLLIMSFIELVLDRLLLPLAGLFNAFISSSMFCPSAFNSLSISICPYYSMNSSAPIYPPPTLIKSFPFLICTNNFLDPNKYFPGPSLLTGKLI